MLATLVLTTTCLAQTEPATRPANQWVQASSPQLGVKFSKPESWMLVVRPPVADMPPDARKVDAIAFDQVDDSQTHVSLMRSPVRPDAGSQAQIVDEIVQVHRDASKKNNLRVIQDTEWRIAGCPGWIFTTEVTRMEFEMRVMVVCFVSRDHEYKLAVAGQKDFFDDVRPKVMKMIDSMELIDAKRTSDGP
jgi:hypothetical protein